MGNYIKTLFYVLLIIVTCSIKETDAICSISSGGVYTFGMNCKYMCHCKNEAACDSDIGVCQNGCAKNWFGPGCQYRDLAEGEMSQHLDNVGNLWSYMANDGDLGTCSETNVATASRTISPWWRLWLPRNETFTSLELFTRNGSLQYFNGFNVSVEYVPADKFRDREYYPPDPQLCYKHSNFAPTDKKIYVTCDKPLIGNQVRIQLATTKTQLVLCDVRVNGGRNMAFKKEATSSSRYDESLYPPSKIVDGDTRNNFWNYCFNTAATSSERVDMIGINLDHISYITFIRLTYPGYSYINNYKLHVSNTTVVSEAVMVHDDTGNDTPTREIALDVIAQYVGMTRRSTYQTAICEMEVYGDCVPGECGYDCSKRCHCKTLEDRMSGNCVSGCEGRWTDKEGQCMSKCGDNQWGSNCAYQCGRCRDTAPCEIETGYCPFGCADGYTDSPKCNTECSDNTYGEGCRYQCSGNCIDGKPCRKSDGYCQEGCNPGYSGGKCDEECPSGKYGYNCSLDCSTHCDGGFSSCDNVDGTCIQGCVAGWEGQICDKECKAGFWNKSCKQKCGNCFSGTCDAVTGNCETGCAAGYKYTDKCTTECDQYTFGIKCAGQCSSNCKDVCDKANGSCNCKRGWKGNNCTQECVAGEWGENCAEKCGKCLNGTCDRFSGKCISGCMPGYTDTPMCNEKCPAGKYGSGCLSNCSANCKIPHECNNEDGSCAGCIAGKQGDFCETDCEIGQYGENCQQFCGACAMNITCDGITGHCAIGCSRGYKHSLLCDEECDDGTHGENCTKACGNCKPGTFCDKVTGICLAGCAEGYKPGVCLEALIQDGDFPVGAVAGGVSAAVVVVIVVLVLFFLKRRRKPVEKRSESTLGFDADAVRGSLKKTESDGRENVYINSITIQEEDKNLIAPDDTAKYVESVVVPEPDEKRSSDRKTGVLTKIEDESADIYYNEGPVSRRRTEHVVLVSELEEYVKKRVTDKGGFTNEFEKLPSGLQHPTTVAKKVENMGKNRYKALYAYDHSRVKLKILPNLPDSDYINASLIKGYFKNDAYIASQGPTEFNIHEFWRMIWEKDVFTIVMVTRLVEETKMKCMQYWPEEGNTEEYGPVMVTTEAEDIYAESKIRRLNVSHQDEPGKSRKVTQFHYIAWPDKDVPRSTSSLLHFWYEVRKHDESKKHPWLVHCSAGVGRTGTFIALDLLYDQGSDQGCIDVFQCVKDLRDQRVNLVQTKEQYRYLYSILVEALVLTWKPIQFENVTAVYRDLQDVDNKTGKTKLFMEYETLLQETGSGNDLEEVDEMYTSAKHTENRNKNRYDNILAPNDYRPFLFTHVKGRTNYINAVYMPSYCDIHSYILTQTPLPETAIDCCRLGLEQEVSAIVTFDERTNEEVGEYLPDSGTINVGPFTVSLVSEEDRAHYKMKQYKLHFDSKKHSFTQLVCKHWPPSQVIPTDPNRMLALLQELECIQRQEVNKPIVVQCLNGAERSGLIVVLMNILEHLRFHNEVSIPQIIRQLRIRRQQIIPNFEQYKFCYDVLLAHVENSTTYANV